MKYLSLFSGVGGFELGIQYANNQSGTVEQQGKSVRNDIQRPRNSTDNKRRDTRLLDWSCVGYSEIDKYAIEVYEKHFNHTNYGDITEINTDDLPDFDVLVGGFPCQAFSIAGKRKGFTDTRGTLFFEIARIVREKQPRLLLLENVKGLLSHDKGNTFHTIITTLDELGYDLQWQVLNSKNHGVPQNRERVFIIGHLRGTGRPEVFPFGGDDEADAGGIKVVGDMVGEKWERFNESSRRVYDTEGISPTVPTSAGGGHMPKIAVHNLQQRSATRPSLTRICDCGSGKLYKKCHGVDGGSGHLSRKDGNTYCLDRTTQGVELEGKIRRFTPKECERLQGFPDDWTEGVSDTQRYKMMGNAVTVNVVQDIIEKLTWSLKN